MNSTILAKMKAVGPLERCNNGACMTRKETHRALLESKRIPQNDLKILLLQSDRRGTLALKEIKKRRRTNYSIPELSRHEVQIYLLNNSTNSSLGCKEVGKVVKL